MIVVSDAGPLIALAKIERFELLRSILVHLCIPQAVYDEVVVKGAGRAGTDETEKALGDWIDVLSVKNVAMVRSLLTKLGKGESEAIALAAERKADLVLLDDRQARTVAKFMRLNVSGSVGVLIQAHREGLVTDLQQVLDELRERGFWIGDDVYSEALKVE